MSMSMMCRNWCFSHSCLMLQHPCGRESILVSSYLHLSGMDLSQLLVGNGVEARAVQEIIWASQLTALYPRHYSECLTYGQPRSCPSQTPSSPAWSRCTSPASPGLPSPLHSPFVHHDALLDTVSCWQALLSPTSSSWTLFEPCRSPPCPALWRCSISVILAVATCGVRCSHLGSNCLLELSEARQPWEPSARPVLPAGLPHSPAAPVASPVLLSTRGWESVSSLCP